MSDQFTNNEKDAAKEEMSADNYRVVLCGANAYEKKYYFNNKFDKIPENIKEELHIICVLFTEEVGGVFTRRWKKGIFSMTRSAQSFSRRRFAERKPICSGPFPSISR